MWDTKPRGFMKKWKSKPRTHRPVKDAEPLVAPTVSAPTTAPNIRNQTIGDREQAHPPTYQDQTNAAAIHQGPDSPETLAGGSPVCVLKNIAHWLSPTLGEREFVQIDLGDRGWKFVTVLYQTVLDKEKTRDSRSLHPRKNVLLYVRPNELANIEDVGVEFIVTSRVFTNCSPATRRQTC